MQEDDNKSFDHTFFNEGKICLRQFKFKLSEVKDLNLPDNEMDNLTDFLHCEENGFIYEKDISKINEATYNAEKNELTDKEAGEEQKESTAADDGEKKLIVPADIFKYFLFLIQERGLEVEKLFESNKAGEDAENLKVDELCKMLSSILEHDLSEQDRGVVQEHITDKI